MDKKFFFGTDGWRGLLDLEINHESVAMVAQAFSDYIKTTSKTEKIEIAVGFDGRKYSEEFAEAFSQVLSGNELLVYLSDKIIPTPVLSYYVKANKLTAGVMITASHNPPAYNGIKFKGPYGGPFITEETLKVEQLIGNNSIIRSSSNIKIADFLQIYFKQLEDYIDFNSIKESGINILVDSMGGAGQKYLEKILQNHGCNVTTIYGTAQNDFCGRTPEPIEKNLQEIKEYLKKYPRFSFGAATDGDADRCGILMEDSSWLSAQYTILLLNDYFVNQKKVSGSLVKTSSVTDKIKLFESSERKVFDVQVGFKYICEKMLSEEIAIGCEESGGYGYKNHIPERDGILSTLLIAEMLAKSGFFRLSEYYTDKKNRYGDIYYDRIDYKYEGSGRAEILPALFLNPPKQLLGVKVTEVLEFYSSRGIVNGLKFILEGNSRWILLRSSETEPLVRIYAESNTSEEVQELLKAGIEIILNK